MFAAKGVNSAHVERWHAFLLLLLLLFSHVFLFFSPLFSNSKTLILKDSSVRSIWTYLTASPCFVRIFFFLCCTVSCQSGTISRHQTWSHLLKCLKSHLCKQWRCHGVWHARFFCSVMCPASTLWSRLTLLVHSVLLFCRGNVQRGRGRGNSCDILLAILGLRHHQNHPNSVIWSE